MLGQILPRRDHLQEYGVVDCGNAKLNAKTLFVALDRIGACPSCSNDLRRFLRRCAFRLRI